MIIFVLFCMLFLHIVDDFYLQGLLASMKQKKWWEENAPDELYKKDYKMALFIHAFSWSFMMHLPIVCYKFFTNGTSELFFALYALSLVVNVMIHAFVDNKKANDRTINLISDQICHIYQIVFVWLIFT